jgi:phage terminase large subunit-like protein
VEDDSIWGIIYTIDDGDDEFDEKSWIKANPNYGVSVMPEDMRRLATKAKASAQARAQFLTKRLNVWVAADSAWMNMLRWDACANPALKEEQFKGRRCWIALDAAFKKDLFAAVKVFWQGNTLIAFGRYYMPSAAVESDGNEHLAAWARQGWIRTTPGEVLDIGAVREDLLEDTRKFEVVEVPYDPAQLTQFASEMLNDHGVPMVELRPTVLNFSPAMKELDERVTAGPAMFQHNGDPVLAWAIANVVCHRDRKDNIYPNKEKPEQKIDPAVALIMAIARAMARPEKAVEPSIVLL